MTQTWHDVLFVHWAVPPEVLSRALPAPLPLDTLEGEAWVSAVVFGIRNFRPRFAPPIPGISAFPEANLRTYVTIDGKPGVYFFSLDTNSLLSVVGARIFFHLRYFRAATYLRRQGESVHFRSARRRPDNPGVIEVEYAPAGAASNPKRATLDYWLVERYCLYAVDRKQNIYRAEIHHPPWALQPARVTIKTNTLGLSIGLDLTTGTPLLHYAGRQDVLMWFRQRL
jgi:uncharacterized protein YqjF (DUF2071 family)